MTPETFGTWIKADERKPASGTEEVIVLYFPGTTERLYELAYWDEREQAWIRSLELETIEWPVTHWMPLPPLPERT